MTHKVVITDNAKDINDYLEAGHWFVVSVTPTKNYKGQAYLCFVIEKKTTLG